MAHPKTIEAFKDAGYDYKTWHENGNEAHNRAIKPAIEKDPNRIVKINSVYRKKVESEDKDNNGQLTEVIIWDSITIAINATKLAVLARMLSVMEQEKPAINVRHVLTS